VNARADQAYYETEVQPLLAGPGVELIGPVGGVEKTQFLRHAAALLFPIRWPEPFGLVMAEALACGTPVLALRRGSVPEVLRDGVTGFIRDTEDELIEAVSRIGEIDRAQCRAEAERRFSPAIMAAAYERVYAHALQQRSTPTPRDARVISRASAARPRCPDEPRVSQEPDLGVANEPLFEQLHGRTEGMAPPASNRSGTQEDPAWEA
jgi:hypothetical protein